MWTFAALAAVGMVPMPLPDLGWMAGYWLSCDNERDVAETWTERRGDVMLGTSATTGRNAYFWEQMRIEFAAADPHSATFFAQPTGADEATGFALVRAAAGEAVFENPANDYPQRITYRREGETLTGRIERMDGSDPVVWRFRQAALNARCPS